MCCDWANNVHYMVREDQLTIDTTQIADFYITEIDIFKCSNFRRYDLHSNDRYFIVIGFEIWNGVFCRNDEWMVRRWWLQKTLGVAFDHLRAHRIFAATNN